MIIWKFLSNLSHFYSSSAVKTVFCTITFPLKKDRLDTYLLTNTITFVKYLKSFEVQYVTYKCDLYIRHDEYL